MGTEVCLTLLQPLHRLHSLLRMMTMTEPVLQAIAVK